MHAHMPPFSPNQHPGARLLYDETSAIAAAQDAQLDPVIDVESRVRTAMQYLYHAQLLLKEAYPARARPNAGIPAESAYLASFSPNADIPSSSSLADSRIATPAEAAYLLRTYEPWHAADLRKYGIGDIEPATLRGIPDSFTDSHGNRITRRHPMAAEALRDEYERGDGETGL